MRSFLVFVLAALLLAFSSHGSQIIKEYSYGAGQQTTTLREIQDMLDKGWRITSVIPIQENWISGTGGRVNKLIIVYDNDKAVLQWAQ